MIWLIAKDLVVRRWWLFGLGVVWAALPVDSPAYWLMFFIALGGIFQREQQDGAFGVLATLPASRAALGRLYWFVAVPLFPLCMLAGFWLRTEVLPFGADLHAPTLSTFLMLEALLMAIVAMIVIATYASKWLSSAIANGIRIVVALFGYMVLISITKSTLIGTSGEWLESHGAAMLAFSLSAIAVSFLLSPKLMYLAVGRSGESRGTFWVRTGKKARVAVGARRLGFLHFWTLPLRKAVVFMILVPLVMAAVVVLKDWDSEFGLSSNIQQSLAQIDAHGFPPFFVMLLAMPLIGMAFYWLDSLRVLRALPVSRRSLAMSVFSIPVQTFALVIITLVLLAQVIGMQNLTLFLTASAYCFVIACCASLVHVKHGLKSAQMFLVGLVMMVMPGMMLLQERLLYLLNPIAATVVVVLTVVLGFPYLERLLLTRSYR